MKKVGIIKEIFVYPVKSMRGISVQRATLGWNGLDGDRRFAFLDRSNKTGFPYLTGREFNKLILYQPYFTDQNNLKASKVMVRTPEGEGYEVSDPLLLKEISKESKKGLDLLHLWRGNFDSTAISLITANTISQIGEGVGQKLDPRRFRPNILIEVVGNSHYPEDLWVGKVLIFGEREDSALVSVNKKDKRCVMITLDPETSVSDPEILKFVAKNHENCAGVYGSCEKFGTIEVGDSVYL